MRSDSSGFIRSRCTRIVLLDRPEEPASHCGPTPARWSDAVRRGERRRIDPADARATALFERYGYPHVLERFRFHMTLTGPLEDALARQDLSKASA